MLPLKNKPLEPEALDLLQQYQQQVDSKASFSEQVAEGRRLFAQYNTKSNRAFKVVRDHLAAMSGGTLRCNYCEDSNANQVEHIYPKNYYPQRCFVWENYCYACGPCNQPKSDQFAVREYDTDTVVNLKERPEHTAPPAGQALLLNPREEDPLAYLFLDTRDTFRFVPYKDTDKDIQREAYTIEILGLNTRNHLIRARKLAFDNFKARLFEYVHKKEAGESPQALQPLIDSLRSEHHQTVWHEMIRQRSLHPEVDDLLNRAEEALSWI